MHFQNALTRTVKYLYTSSVSRLIPKTSSQKEILYFQFAVLILHYFNLENMRKLKYRLASGEITLEEYETLKSQLENE